MTLIPLAMSFLLFQGEPPKPEKEHEWLKQFEGTWETTMSMNGQEGEKGTETAKLKHGGLWLEMDVKMGAKSEFTGSGVLGYDPKSKKFQMCWVDVMSPKLQISEGTLDKAGKVLTLETEMDMNGTAVKAKWKWEAVDKDTKKFSISSMSGDGMDAKEEEMIVVTYKRKK
jgi:hypothetical protein